MCVYIYVPINIFVCVLFCACVSAPVVVPLAAGDNSHISAFCCSICNNIHLQYRALLRRIDASFTESITWQLCCSFDISMCNMNLQCRASSFAKNRWLVFRNSHMAASLLNLQYNLSGKLTS